MPGKNIVLLDIFFDNIIISGKMHENHSLNPTRAEINLSAFDHNIRQIRKLTGNKVKILVPVKADAYGHGSIEISRRCEKLGVEMLGVANVDEAQQLINQNISLPILILGLLEPSAFQEAINLNLRITLCDKYQINIINQMAESCKKIISVHLKVDTGMRRIGCQPSEAITLAKLIKNKKNLILEGFWTHFPVSDSQDKTFTQNQMKIFKGLINELKENNITIPIIHTANSGGIINYPESHFDMVRPGIMSYGYFPCPGMDVSLSLQPLMSFKTRIIFLKLLDKGVPISYGLKYTTRNKTWIATLPVGYADGYNRQLTNKGKVLIKNNLYPVKGVITMDQTLVELGKKHNLDLYDDVHLFGPKKYGCWDANEMAGILNTISYEILCSVGKRVPRVYIEE